MAGGSDPARRPVADKAANNIHEEGNARMFCVDFSKNLNTQSTSDDVCPQSGPSHDSASPGQPAAMHMDPALMQQFMTMMASYEAKKRKAKKKRKVHEISSEDSDSEEEADSEDDSQEEDEEDEDHDPLDKLGGCNFPYSVHCTTEIVVVVTGLVTVYS